MLVMGACTRCLMYVMLNKCDPKCPRCESQVPLDFTNATHPPASKRQRVELPESASEHAQVWKWVSRIALFLHAKLVWLSNAPAKLVMTLIHSCPNLLLWGMWVLFDSSFVFSNSYRLDSHDETCVALANLRWRVNKNWVETRTSPDLVWIRVTGLISYLNTQETRTSPDLVWFRVTGLISYLNTQVLPIVLIIKCGVVNQIWRHSSISSQHVCLWCLFFVPRLTTQQSNLGIRYRNVT